MILPGPLGGGGGNMVNQLSYKACNPSFDAPYSADNGMGNEIFIYTHFCGDNKPFITPNFQHSAANLTGSSDPIGL